ncbi:hypothetical protein [Deinococcus marmoris]|uniref:Uncharacterized protein n=1 Tax=Deinococcus marmoris TaxID=249408 RepID=A0A1U7P4X7_9DEIO|nr:hypothetical protein [Deinococcus marmoris]OLV20223.1 hypothetical protein BOO71_0000697 [Deinococcus marmoris]
MSHKLIVLGERGRTPHLLLLGCTVHADRIEARAYIAHAPLRRARTLDGMQKGEGGWTVPRGGLRARVPRLAEEGIFLHTPITVMLVRRGKL